MPSVSAERLQFIEPMYAQSVQQLPEGKDWLYEVKIVNLLTQLGYPGTETFIGEKITQLINHPDEELIVAVESGDVLGFISIHFIPQIALRGAFARISYLCVDEIARSRGIGRELESYCERIARERGCDRIELHCHSRRTLAHQFYYRQGYEESPKYLVKNLH